MKRGRLFFDYSISAMLTLLANGIVRPCDPNGPADLTRVDQQLRVIDLLATSTERPDLLEKKEFVLHMRLWTVTVLQAAKEKADFSYSELPCVKARYGDGSESAGADQQAVDALFGDCMPYMDDNLHPDVFPYDLMNSRAPW